MQLKDVWARSRREGLGEFVVEVEVGWGVEKKLELAAAFKEKVGNA